MSVSSQIARIVEDKNKIAAKLEDFGLVEAGANLDALATAVEGIANRGKQTATLGYYGKGSSTEWVYSATIPEGYHDGTGAVTINFETPTPVTPTKSSKTITPAVGKVLKQVTVLAIPDEYQDVSDVDALDADVRNGKKIVAADGTVVTGTMPENEAQFVFLTENKQAYTIPAGYHDGTGAVTINLETKEVTPTEESQTITPSSGNVLRSVTVNPIPDNYADISGVEATNETVLSGFKYVNNKGVLCTGTMPERSEEDVTVSGASVTIPRGYYDYEVEASVNNIGAKTFVVDPLITEDDDQDMTYTFLNGYVTSVTITLDPKLEAALAAI